MKKFTILDEFKAYIFNKMFKLIAFDVFLDQVTVLPPGEWDPKIRLDPPQKIPDKVKFFKHYAKKIY